MTSFTTVLNEAGDGIIVIVNKENPVITLTASEVKLYYLRKIKKRWPGINKNIRPTDLKKKTIERDAFYSQILGMKEDEVMQYFMNKQIQNAERPPDRFASDIEILNFIADEPGGIGYIKASSFTNEFSNRVKAVYVLNL